MSEFGFSLHPSSNVDLDKLDRSLFNKLADVEPDILKCIACGSCAATCSAGNYTTINLRRIMLLLEREIDQDALNQIKKCMLCGKCSLVCPRGINTRRIIMTIYQLYNK